MPRIDYDGGHYVISTTLETVQVTQVKPDIQVVIVRHGNTYYVSRVFRAGARHGEEQRLPQYWNECASLAAANRAHDDLVKTS